MMYVNFNKAVNYFISGSTNEIHTNRIQHVYSHCDLLLRCPIMFWEACVSPLAVAAVEL